MTQLTDTIICGREVTEQSAKSCSPTKEPELYNHLINFIRIGSCVEDWVRSEKRAKCRLEELEGGHLGIRILHHGSIILLPIVSNLGLGQIFEHFFIIPSPWNWVGAWQ